MRATSSPRSSTAVLLRLAFALVAVLPLACATARHPPSSGISVDELLAGEVLGVASAVEVADEGLLSLSPEMKSFLATHVDQRANSEVRLRQLVTAIIDSSTFGVEYDEKTRTAAETFRMRRGNCLSFSNLFVAMARATGLEVAFQEVEIPPDWTVDKDTFVLNQHVNVHVDLHEGGQKVVDFNIGDFRTTYDMRRISDARALAHYYNNAGVERMQAGDTGAALACFRKAIAAGDRAYSPAWTNLGTLYLRNGRIRHAEAAYLHALHASPSDLVAMSNLARLCELTGDTERADAYQKRVIHHRRINPYYRFELARQAFAAQQYDDAIAHLRFAVRKRPREDRFYFLLGLSYLKKGEEAAARRWLARAEEIAGTDETRRRYSNKIDILLRHANH